MDKRLIITILAVLALFGIVALFVQDRHAA